MKNNPFLKVFEIPKNFSQKVLRRVKGRALAHPPPPTNQNLKINHSTIQSFGKNYGIQDQKNRI